MLHSVFDESTINSFDEFFDNELYQLQNGGRSRHSFHSAEPYSSEAHVTEEGRVSSSSTHRDLTQDWRQHPQYVVQEPEIFVEKTRKAQHQPYLIPPSDVESNDYIIETNLLGDHAGYRVRSDYEQPADQHVRDEFRFDRQKTLSPTPAYACISPDEIDPHISSWQQDFQDFHLESALDNNVLYSEGQEVHGGFVSRNPGPTRDRDRAYASQIPTRYHYPFQAAFHMGSKQPSMAISTSALPQSYLQPATEMKISRSSDGSQTSSLSHGSQVSSSNIRNSYQYPALRSCRSTGNFQKGNASNITAPLPRGKAHNITNQRYNSPADGLGILYPMPDEIGCAVPYTPFETIEHQVQATPQSQKDNPFTTYPPLPPVPVDPAFDVCNTRHRRNQSLSCSPSPPLSPAYPALHRNLQHNSPSRPGRARRKSIHRIGPVKEINNSGSSPTHSRSRNRSSSRSRSAHIRTRSLSAKPAKPGKQSSNPVTATTTPTNAMFDFDFVNYTAQDSEKLMSDVAPSGSSKTRARREQEARDRRKKFNEAAIIAVRKAGGNVQDLQHRLAS